MFPPVLDHSFIEYVLDHPKKETLCTNRVASGAFTICVAVGSILGYFAGSTTIAAHAVVVLVNVAPVDAAFPPSSTAFQHVVVALPPLITRGAFNLLNPVGPVVEMYAHLSAELHPYALHDATLMTYKVLGVKQ